MNAFKIKLHLGGEGHCCMMTMLVLTAYLLFFLENNKNTNITLTDSLSVYVNKTQCLSVYKKFVI